MSMAMMKLLAIPGVHDLSILCCMTKAQYKVVDRLGLSYSTSQELNKTSMWSWLGLQNFIVKKLLSEVNSLSFITATSSNVFRHSLITQNFHMILSLPLNDITPTPCKHVTFIARCILETGGGLYRCVSGPTLRLNWYVILDGPGSTLCWCNCHPGGHILRQNTAYPIPWEDSISHVYDHR